MKRIILVIAIMFAVLAGGNFRAAAQQYDQIYTVEELQELLQLMCDMFNETEESGNPDVAIEYMRYDGDANKLVIRYKINSASLFSDIRNTPHSELKERFLPLLAKKYMGDADVKQMMTLVFTQLDPHVVYQFSNGKGTTVNCEFEGTEVAHTMGGTYSNTLVAAKSDEESEAANELAALVEEEKASITQDPEDSFNFYDLTYNRASNTVSIYGEFNISYDDFMAARDELIEERMALLASFGDWPLLHAIVANNGEFCMILRCSEAPGRSPLTLRFTGKEIRDVLE